SMSALPLLAGSYALATRAYPAVPADSSLAPVVPGSPSCSETCDTVAATPSTARLRPSVLVAMPLLLSLPDALHRRRGEHAEAGHERLDLGEHHHGGGDDRPDVPLHVGGQGDAEHRQQPQRRCFDGLKLR